MRREICSVYDARPERRLGCHQSGLVPLDPDAVEAQHDGWKSWASDADVPSDDARWPHSCRCGYVFTEADSRQVLTWPLLALPSGLRVTWDHAPVGAVDTSGYRPRVQVPGHHDGFPDKALSSNASFGPSQSCNLDVVSERSLPGPKQLERVYRQYYGKVSRALGVGQCVRATANLASADSFSEWRGAAISDPQFPVTARTLLVRGGANSMLLSERDADEVRRWTEEHVTPKSGVEPLVFAREWF